MYIYFSTSQIFFNSTVQDGKIKYRIEFQSFIKLVIMKFVLNYVKIRTTFIGNIHFQRFMQFSDSHFLVHFLNITYKILEINTL